MFQLTLIYFIILSLVHAFDSAHLGQIKHTVQVAQQFEHQFFGIPGISSIDLYFTQSPFRKVQNEDLDCFWSQQDIGLQKITEWSVNKFEQYMQGDVLCLGDQICYITAGSTLYVVNAQYIKQKRVKFIIAQQNQALYSEIDLTFHKAKILNFSGIGLLGFLSVDNQIELLDISNPVKPLQTTFTFEDRLLKSLQSSIEVLTDSNTNTLYINVGEHIELWNLQHINQIHKVGTIFMEGIAYTKEQEEILKIQISERENNLKQMNILNDLLFIFCDRKGVLAYDISDPLSIIKLGLVIDSQDDGSAFSQSSFSKMGAQKDQLILLHQNTSNSYCKFYHYQINQNNDLKSVKMQLLLSGYIDIKVTENIERIYLNYNYTAFVVSESQITIVQLLTKPLNISVHQNFHHPTENNLTTFQHLLPSLQNQVYSSFGQIFQFHDNKLKVFQQAVESYDIFCNAPGYNITKNQDMIFEYYGIIRSSEHCLDQFQINKTQKQPTNILQIIQREQPELHKETKCLVSFDFIIKVEKKTSNMNKKLLLLILVIFIVVFSIGVNLVRKSCKKNMIRKTLQKFEELNSQIGINSKKHVPQEDSEEWKYLARIQQDSFAKFDQIIKIDDQDE